MRDTDNKRDYLRYISPDFLNPKIEMHKITITEAFKTIDATKGMFESLAQEIDKRETFLEKEVWTNIENVYIPEGGTFEMMTEHYYNNEENGNQINLVDISPVCCYLVNEWTSASLNRVRCELDKLYQHATALTAKYMKADLEYVTAQGYEFQRLHKSSETIRSFMLDSIHDMHMALKNTKDENEDTPYKLANGRKGHMALLIAAMYDDGWFVKNDSSPASNVEDLARSLGKAFGEEFNNWRQTLKAAIDHQKNSHNIFDDLQNKILKRRQDCMNSAK